MFNRFVYLDDPTQTTKRDTALAGDGAPGKAGEFRIHLHRTYGWQVYQLVWNSSGAALVKGTAAIYKASSDIEVLVGGTGADARRIAGVPQVNIPDGYYGWALFGGTGQVLSNDAIATDKYLFSASAAGKMDDLAGAPASVADNLKVFARSLAAAAGADELIAAKMLLFSVS